MSAGQFDPVATAVLGLVERLVGRGHQLLGQARMVLAGRLLRQHGQADGDRHRQRRALGGGQRRSGHGGADALGDLAGMALGGLGQQRDELLATVAGNGVAGAQLAVDQPPHPAQHVIATLVAMGVVDALEAIDVQEHAGQGMAMPPRLRDLDLAAVLEVAAVVDAGEAVGQARQLQAFLVQRTLQAHRGDAAQALLGKKSAQYVKNFVLPVTVNIVNAGKMKISEKREAETTYIRYTGYPGGLRSRTMSELKTKKGLEEVVRVTVDGMIPRNKLRKERMKRLSITL